MYRMRNSVSGILEVVWFVLGGLLLVMAVNVTLSVSLAESWPYFLLSVLAFAMYYLRRRMRLKQR
jgi:hypothetical protein